MNGIETGVLISLALYFLLMIAIGVWAYFKADNDSAGYMLGGRNLSPGVAALSAGASDMSGCLNRCLCQLPIGSTKTTCLYRNR